MPKMEFDKNLWSRITAFAGEQGYSSPEEFVQHVVEAAIGKDDPGEGEKGAGKIKGIGYIDAGLDI
jgi:hypothetical protein